jgi:pyruvate/2-oxoglutarate dehydrogenase complex dihydrolipoamide dehydrogenase (E3) component
VTPDQLAGLGIQLIGAPGRFLDRRTLAAGEQRVRARRFVIATGSRPLVPEIPGLAEVPYFTSATLFDNTRKLTHLVVIGAGAVALELAQACRRLGAEVTVVAPETPLAGRDPELGAIVLRQLADEGISLRVATEVARVEGRSLGIGVAVRTAAGEETLDASHILVAAGAAPVLEGLALEKAGVRVEGTNGAARLVLGTGLRTSNFRIYAAGDVVDGEGSVHAAARHAAVVVERALFGLPARVAPGTLPAAVFTDPELAETGLTEPELLRRRGDFRVLRVSLGENDRARMERQAHGLVKLVVGRGGRLLGAGIVGAGAAEMISLFSLAIANGLPLGALARFSAPYPTLTEAVRAVAEEGLADEPASPLRRRLLALRRVLP